MLTITLDPELEKKLDQIARKLGRSKDDFAREAILRLIEDEEDYREAVVQMDKPARRIPLSEMKKRLGLDH